MLIKKHIVHSLFLDWRKLRFNDLLNKDPYLVKWKKSLLYWLNAFGIKINNFSDAFVCTGYNSSNKLKIRDNTLDFTMPTDLHIEFAIRGNDFTSNKELLERLSHYFYIFLGEDYVLNLFDTYLFSIYAFDHYFTISVSYYPSGYRKAIGSIPWEKIGQASQPDYRIITSLFEDALSKTDAFENIYNKLRPIIDKFFLPILDE